MGDARPPLAAFDPETIDAVAADADLSADALGDLVARHQDGVRDLPGVEDIVYEWRSQFHEDPLVHRSAAAYVLAHRPHVWQEFVDAMALSDAEGEALVAVHERQARAILADDAADRLGAGDAMVLTRP